MENLNNKLHELYLSKWQDVQRELSCIHKEDKLTIKPANPLLLYVNEEDIKHSDIRIMIFGQETNQWGDGSKILTIGIDDLFNEYDCFNSDRGRGYGGQFWNGFQKICQMIEEKFPNKKLYPVWNNIIKIGKDDREKGCPPDYIYEIERKYFSVIQDEIEIIKPDIILFLTGPNYDNEIADNFGKLTYSAINPFSERQLAKISLPEVAFAFRTYHPNYLWRNDIEGYYNAIINEINLKM